MVPTAAATAAGREEAHPGRFPGREYLVVQAKGTNAVLRTRWMRGRLYQLMVTGGAGIEAQPHTRRFFESFALMTP
jgi:hypothetical protein